MKNDEQSIPVMVRLMPDQVERLDEWRRAQKDLPGRPEAIRRILDDRLKSSEADTCCGAQINASNRVNLSWQNHPAASRLPGARPDARRLCGPVGT